MWLASSNLHYNGKNYCFCFIKFLFLHELWHIAILRTGNNCINI